MVVAAPLPDGGVVAVHEIVHHSGASVRREPDGDVREELFAPTPAAVRAFSRRSPARQLRVVRRHGRARLALPTAGASQDTVPGVVQPHGGPTSVTGDEWDGVAQYFVDKGYVWFAINFRGSTSYGRDFERADHGVWGVADTHDCLAAHDHLVSLGWVDPSRVAIFGASYGSYLALASVVDDGDHRYACAITKYGDCDILTSWAQGDLYVGRLDLERMMGHPHDHRAGVRRRFAHSSRGAPAGPRLRRPRRASMIVCTRTSRRNSSPHCDGPASSTNTSRTRPRATGCCAPSRSCISIVGSSGFSTGT